MSIDSLKNRVMKKVNLQQYKTDYTDIGSFIKKRRKELNITQDEITTGICSISYLSKIENNQIVPNDFYVREIMEKLDIKEEVYEKSLKDREYIKKTLRAIFDMDEETLKQLYEELKEIEHNVVINICKLGYMVYFHHIDENQYVMMLENLVNNMSNYDLKVYLYFASTYFVQNEKYKTALELVELNENVPGNDEILSALFYELSYYVKQRLLVKNSASEDYYNAMNIYQRYHNIKRIIYLALNKSAVLAKENPKKALTILSTIKIVDLPIEIKGLYYYTKAEVLYKLKRYNDATLALKPIEETSNYYLRKMILLFHICTLFDDLEMIQNIKKILDHYQPHKCELKNKIYYHYLLQEDDSDKKEYLRDIAIPFSIQIEDYESLKKYTDHVMQICFETSRYKEAMQYYKKYQKEMDKVKTILY